MFKDNALAIINSYESADFYRFGAIPTHKIETAVVHYPVDPTETALALIDATLFGTAKNGMVIGVKGIYWRNDSATKTERNSLSWDELACGDTAIKTTWFDIELMPGCMFNMSGCNMKKGLLVKLLQDLAQLHRIESMNIYVQVLPELIALYMVANDLVDESTIDIATNVIANEDLADNTPFVLESLVSNLKKLTSDKEKSKAIFNLRVSSIIAKVDNLNCKSLKRRLSEILRGMSSVARKADSEQAENILRSIRS